jgi:hypothetical protein
LITSTPKAGRRLCWSQSRKSTCLRKILLK